MRNAKLSRKSISTKEHTIHSSHTFRFVWFFFKFYLPCRRPSNAISLIRPTRPCHIEFEVLRYEWGMRVRRQRAVEHGSKKECWMWIEKDVKYFFLKALQCCYQTDNMKFWYIFSPTQWRANLTSSIFFFWLLEKHPARSAISAKLGYLPILFFIFHTLFVWINVVYEKLAKHDVTNNTAIFIISSRQQQVSAYLKSRRKYCISLTSMEACRTFQSSLAVILWHEKELRQFSITWQIAREPTSTFSHLKDHHFTCKREWDYIHLFEDLKRISFRFTQKRCHLGWRMSITDARFLS